MRDLCFVYRTIQITNLYTQKKLYHKSTQYEEETTHVMARLTQENTSNRITMKTNKINYQSNSLITRLGIRFKPKL